MFFHRLSYCVVILLLWTACGKEDDEPAQTVAPSINTSTNTNTGEQLPLDQSLATLNKFLIDKKYQDWKSEKEIHQGSSHGWVKVYFNDLLAESIKNQNSEHPVGSMSVKELYESDLSTLKGFATSLKVNAGVANDSWLWYEGLSPNYNEYFGQSVPVCVNCHKSATDFMFSAP